MTNRVTAKLVLDDGTTFPGFLFGAAPNLSLIHI